MVDDHNSVHYICINVLIYTCRTKRGAHELDLYLSKKHDELLANNLEEGSYKKTLSLVIVDGFAVEITDDQVRFLFFYFCFFKQKEISLKPKKSTCKVFISG